MQHTIIIAEAGVNHNGDIELAKRLIDVAKESGADIVKFQTAKLDAIVSESAPMAEYQKQNTLKNQSQKEMLKKLLLDYSCFTELAKYCKKQNIKFLSTPFDIESIHFLNDIVPIWKIPSGEITNYPYLVEIAKTGKPVIMSTGMSEISEIDEAMYVLKSNGTKNITLLHCNTQYPTPYDDVNLYAMQSLKKRYNVDVGYSDHTKGIEVPVAAVALGAKVIEKHFTLDCNMEGPDHKASLEPCELKRMVDSIRNIEKSLGSEEKKVSKSEGKNRDVARKSIVAKKTIKKGEMYTSDNITTKRPGTGICPMKWTQVLGKRAMRDFQKDEMIELENED